MRRKLFCYCFFWCNTYDFINHFTVFENQNCRNISDAIIYRNLLIVIHIYFSNYRFSFEICRYFLNNRSQHSTWSTPNCPKINQYWFI